MRRSQGVENKDERRLFVQMTEHDHEVRTESMSKITKSVSYYAIVSYYLCSYK